MEWIQHNVVSCLCYQLSRLDIHHGYQDLLVDGQEEEDDNTGDQPDHKLGHHNNQPQQSSGLHRSLELHGEAPTAGKVPQVS